MVCPALNSRAARIPARRRFKQLPIGPIGAHLTLTDTKWAVAGEVALGGMLETWIVDNKDDNKLLRQLGERVGIRRLDVLVVGFNRRPYTIPQDRQLQPGWANMRQFTKIDHPNPQAKILIDNKLIDSTHYEQIVVDDEQERCRDAAHGGRAGRYVPKVIHVSGMNFTKGRKGTVVSGHYINRRPPRIGASFEDELAQTQNALQDSHVKLAETQRLLTAANAELQQLRQQMQTLTTQEKTALGNKTRVAHRVAQLQAQAPVLEVDEVDGEDLVAEQLQQLQQKLNGLQVDYEKAERELNEAKMMEEQAKKLHMDRNDEMQQTLSQMNATTEQLERLAKEKEDASNAKAQTQAKLEEHDRRVTQIQKNMADVSKNLDTAKEKARELGTEQECAEALQQARSLLKEEITTKLRSKLQQQWKRGQRRYNSEEEFEADLLQHTETAYKTQIEKPETGRGAQYFTKKMAALEQTIAAAEEEAGGNQEVLEISLKRAEAEYKHNDKPVKNMHAVVNMSVSAVQSRWRKYEELFESVKTTVSCKFHSYMHRRGHQGRVDVNPETSELKLLVKMNTQAQGAEAKKSKAVKDLKQLSGGERSYTTVAFILALGKFTENPFRAMDEYDVFMDAVNRRIATQTLLQFALEENELQFVLLTPQDLQAVEDAKQHLAAGRNGQALPEGFVKVVQMRPAREGGQQHH